MSNKQVWVIFTKSKPLPQCLINIDGGEYYFAEVCVAVETDKGIPPLDPIIEQARQHLLESHLELLDVYKCIRYVPEEWPEETLLNRQIHAAAQKAQETGDIGLGGYRSNEVEDECCYQHVVSGFEITS